MKERVAVLGASENPERYAYKAFRMLKDYGHEPLPVSPKLRELEGVPVVAALGDLSGKVDTVTMYVGAAISSRLEGELLALHPRRVIFNPGSENPALMAALEKAGIHVVEACTLVLLRTNQFASA
jgi:uncharacterized protein